MAAPRTDESHHGSPLESHHGSPLESHHGSPHDAPRLGPDPAPLGIVVNPVSGRDVRRLFARAMSSSHESKRNQVLRMMVGAAAAGVSRVVLARDPFRIADGAAEALSLDAPVEVLDIGASCKTADTTTAVLRMREAGCRALLVLGGDGTSRLVAKAWPDACLLPVSTGTNNVFPVMVEATIAGAAAGLVAAGWVARAEAARRVKVVRVEIEGEDDDLALVDGVHLVDDHLGSLLPFDPRSMRRLVVSRALPHAVGMSPVGGLLHPCDADEDAGVLVECTASDGEGRPLLAPISPGLYRRVHVRGSEKLALGERVEIEGPGLLAFDGDRERALAAGQKAWLRVERDGPFVVDPTRALSAGAAAGAYLDVAHWHDARAEGGIDCC